MNEKTERSKLIRDLREAWKKPGEDWEAETIRKANADAAGLLKDPTLWAEVMRPPVEVADPGSSSTPTANNADEAVPQDHRWTRNDIARALSEPTPEWLTKERAEADKEDAGLFADATRNMAEQEEHLRRHELAEEATGTAESQEPTKASGQDDNASNPKPSPEELKRIMFEPDEPEIQKEMDKAQWILPLAMKELAEEATGTAESQEPTKASGQDDNASNPKPSPEELKRIMFEPPEPELQAEIDAAREQDAWSFPIAMRHLHDNKKTESEPSDEDKKRKK